MPSNQDPFAKIIHWLAFIVAGTSSVALAAILIAEMYVRWSVNQNFSFLGGEGVAALTISVFGLILGLAYIHRPRA